MRENLRVRVDLEGAAEIARRAAVFEWTFSSGDLDRFSRASGWAVGDTDEYGVTELHTGLDVNQATGQAIRATAPLAPIPFAPGDLLTVSIRVADATQEYTPASAITAARAFADLADRVLAECGPADTGEFEVGEGLSWIRSGAVLSLRMTASGVDFAILNPKYQRWMDTPGYDE